MSAKVYRRNLRHRCHGKAYSDSMDPFFTLLLSGDVEVNPGPINTKGNRSPVKDNIQNDIDQIDNKIFTSFGKEGRFRSRKSTKHDAKSN